MYKTELTYMIHVHNFGRKKIKRLHQFLFPVEYTCPYHTKFVRTETEKFYTM